MDIIHKRFPVEEISIDELREKEEDEDESTFFEYKLGLYCEMDTDAIGIKTDLSRLFKKGIFTANEKKSLLIDKNFLFVGRSILSRLLCVKKFLPQDVGCFADYSAEGIWQHLFY